MIGHEYLIATFDWLLKYMSQIVIYALLLLLV